MNEKVVNYDGYAVPEKIAKEQYKIIPFIIFKRSDGWTLGAPVEFEDVAHGMWKDEWTHFKFVVDDVWRDINEDA